MSSRNSPNLRRWCGLHNINYHQVHSTMKHEASHMSISGYMKSENNVLRRCLYILSVGAELQTAEVTCDGRTKTMTRSNHRGAYPPASYRTQVQRSALHTSNLPQRLATWEYLSTRTCRCRLLSTGRSRVVFSAR